MQYKFISISKDKKVIQVMSFIAVDLRISEDDGVDLCLLLKRPLSITTASKARSYFDYINLYQCNMPYKSINCKLT